MLTDSELYNISLFLVDNSYLKLDLSDYFTDEEMSRAVSEVADLINEYEDKVAFRNVVYNEDEIKPQYTGFISYQDIAKMYDAGVLNYNFATQRKAKIIKYRNRVERIPTINEHNVSEIKKEVLEGLFEENTVTLNIRPTSDNLCHYDADTRKLEISEDALIDVIDGYHRITAIHDAWKINKNIKGRMVLLIKNISIDKARYFIRQESKGTLNNQEEMRLYDSSSNLAKLINDINTNSNSTNILFGRITSGNNTENTLIIYDIFAHTMDKAWAEKLSKTNIRELMKIRSFICDFYSITYEWIMEKFKVDELDKLKTISDNITLDPMFMSGFLFPAAKMYEENNGQLDMDSIEKMVNKINYGTSDNNFTYENQSDSYEMNRYVKAWSNVI